MKLAVHCRRHETPSLLLYRNEILSRLRKQGVEVIEWTEDQPPNGPLDGVWDPGLGMRRVPAFLCETRVPVVTTVPGLRAFTLPVNKLGSSWKECKEEWQLKKGIRADWRLFSKQVSGVIAISDFGAKDICHALRVPSRLITRIHLAAGPVFQLPDPAIDSRESPVGFLHVSVFRPGKNTQGVLAAYDRLPRRSRPPLTLRCSRLPTSIKLPEGVQLISEHLSESELAALYQKALAFIFPSVYEHFGLPILEAMACGCPVITSNRSACPEVAGDAALLVSPKDIRGLSAQMARLAEDAQLRAQLREKGIQRASHFSWKKSAAEHLRLFEKLFGGAKLSGS